MGNYYYLLSSLPLLQKDMQKVPISEENFYDNCKKWLTPKALTVVEKVTLTPSPQVNYNAMPHLKLWFNWDVQLRNAIVHKIATPGSDLADFLHPEKDYFSEIKLGVQEAFAAQSPWEREYYLYSMRWKRLEDLEGTTTFDLERLCLYKLKLLLLLKWTNRLKDKGDQNLTDILCKIDSNYARGSEQ